MGAKIQCVNVSFTATLVVRAETDAFRLQGKCPKAFHVSCARDDEQVEFDVIEMDEWEPLPIPTDAPEGTQHEFVKRQVYQTNLLCPSHNPVSHPHLGHNVFYLESSSGFATSAKGENIEGERSEKGSPGQRTQRQDHVNHTWSKCQDQDEWRII